MNFNLMKFKCKVVARSSRNEIVGIENLSKLCFDFKNGRTENDLSQIKAYITAVPIKGKANKELIGLLSEELGVSKNRISIIKGKTSNNKIIDIDE